VESDDGATFMVESTGGGLFAQLMQQAEVRPADLDLATSRALLRELAAHVPSTLWNIELDGVDLSGEYVAVCLMNIRYIGPRVCIAPDADPSDGLLDLVLLGPKDLQELCETLGDGPSANGGAPERTSHRGVRAVLLAAEHVPMAVDDELVPHGAHRPRRVTASDSTVRVLVPRPPIGVTR
jgi:diacylglycerol kinase family enzyme